MKGLNQYDLLGKCYKNPSKLFMHPSKTVNLVKDGNDIKLQKSFFTTKEYTPFSNL